MGLHIRFSGHPIQVLTLDCYVITLQYVPEIQGLFRVNMLGPGETIC